MEVNIMENIISNTNFEKIKYSCGYGAIYNVLKHYGYKYTENQLYFLCDGFNFEFIDKTKQIGYNSIYHTYERLSDFCEVMYKKNDKGKDVFNELIMKAIDEEGMILLYLPTEILIYHEVNKPIYPYHVLIAYGYNTEKNMLNIADLYIVSNSGEIKSFVGVLDLELLEKYTIDYVIVKKQLSYSIEKLYIISKNLDNYWNSKYSLSFSLFINNIKYQVKKDPSFLSHEFPNLIISATWAIFIPYFNSCIELCKELHYRELEEKFVDVYKIIERKILQLIKIGYKKDSDIALKAIDDFIVVWNSGIELLKLLHSYIKKEINYE